MPIFRRLFGELHRSPQTLADFLIRGATALVTIGSTSALISHNFIAFTPGEGPSMYPTMTSGLSYTIYSRRHRRGKNVKVGDVILFENPIFLRASACKRVIGMPGDFVLLDPSQSPTVGGASVPGITDEDAKREEPVMVRVPEGHVWVAGDNFSYSRDSRFYGPVPMALITGKALYNGDGWFNWTSFRRPQLTLILESELTPSEFAGELSSEDARPD